MSKLLKIYIAIRKFFQPDYNFIEDKQKKARKQDYSGYVGQKHDLTKIKLEKPLTVENSGLADEADKDKKKDKKDDKKKSGPTISIAGEDDKKSKSKQNKKKESQGVSTGKQKFRTHYDEHENDKPKQSLTKEKLTMEVLSIPKNLDNPMKMQVKPKINQVWTYHDSKRHQLFAHVPANGGFMNKDRDNERRSQLQAWVRPRNGKEYDRTHMLPFGYHGSENDPRLVVGWKKEHNTNELKHFENKAKNLKKNIYWHTDIRRLENGAAWRYTIYDTKTLKQLDQLTLLMDKTPFHWEK